MTGPRVAVVGAGPRALWALERLDAHLGSTGGRLDRVDVFGRGALGAGPVYDVDQPGYLRLNVLGSSVDVWSGRSGGGPSFDDWRERRRPGSSADAFGPRRLMGRYLHEQAERVLASLRERLGAGAVVVHDERVHRIRRTRGGWRLDERDPHDEVLLAVGHEDDWEGALRHDWPVQLPPLHPTVFPVDELLARPQVRPGATVLVRGAALTAIDAVLALTLGRGRDPADGDVKIVLASRSGRLMIPKSLPSVVAKRLAGAGELGDLRKRVREGDDVPTVVGELAGRLLGAEVDVPAELERLDLGVAGLRRSIAIARGDAPVDVAWAIGQAWRALYADLVRRQQDIPAWAPPLDWADYSRWVPELERLAFGPALVNAELLLAGLESGTVQLRRGDVRGMTAGVDLVVDAVLAPPGIADVRADSLLGRLRADAIVHRGPGRRGVRVGADASVLDEAGCPVGGLAMIGRATEDEVLGNDTLIRELHPQVDLWARRVVSTGVVVR